MKSCRLLLACCWLLNVGSLQHPLCQPVRVWGKPNMNHPAVFELYKKNPAQLEHFTRHFVFLDSSPVLFLAAHGPYDGHAESWAFRASREAGRWGTRQVRACGVWQRLEDTCAPCSIETYMEYSRRQTLQKYGSVPYIHSKKKEILGVEADRLFPSVQRIRVVPARSPSPSPYVCRMKALPDPCPY